MKLRITLLSLALVFAATISAAAQGLQYFKLGNGLSVYVWEDPDQPDVYGEVAVHAGSINDPEQYTGLAHYLEHVMFKGTTKIGALDWEQEKPLYEQIIAKYDELAVTADPAAREALTKEINRLSIEQGKLSLTNEYANLIESIGGTSLNAGTSYDVTFFHNSFPANQISKWLTLSAERFINPVFRAFQSELETVYEEYNMYNDNGGTQASQFMFSKLFENQPYARPIIGLGEHLKNPQLSKLMEFYNSWYTPDNMALIIVGPVKAQSIIRLISATYGKLPRREMPERPAMGEFSLKKRTQYTTKCSQYPSVVMGYPGVKSGDPDEIPLEICLKLLNNESETGILDQLVIDGDLMGAMAGNVGFNEQGRCVIQAIPFYDSNLRSYDSNKNVEKMLVKAVDDLVKGNVNDWIVDAVKNTMCRDFDLMMEDAENKASLIRQAFLNGQDPAEALAYKDKVQAVTVDDIKAMAVKYLKANPLVIYNELGKPEKKTKIAKPEIDPIEPPVGQSSQYAAWFKNMKVAPLAENFTDWSKVQQKQINSYSRLYYTQNEENDVYTLELKYGAGSSVFPDLQYAAQLMNNSGVMPNLTSHQLKEAFGRLCTTCQVSADENYLYVTLRGYESTLQEACQLMTRFLLMPSLDEKQLDNVKGGVFGARYARKNDVETLAAALREYAVYGENSRYVTEMTDQKVYDMNIGQLTGDIVKATHYAAEIHYSGLLPFEEVCSILENSLPLVEGEQKSDSPAVRQIRDYTENTVLYLANADAQQSQIYFYIPMGEYDKALSVPADAFNRYMSGGFNGLIMKQIREYNSMAYTAYGNVVSQALPGSRYYYTGYVGTQNDKALDAIDLYSKLLTDMPQQPEAMDNIREFLHQYLLTSRPDNRSLSEAIARWKRQGYTEDPAKSELPQIDALTFDDIVKFYEEQIKGRPIVIAVMGNPKNISADALSKYGKVVKVRENQLFNDKEKLL